MVAPFLTVWVRQRPKAMKGKGSLSNSVIDNSISIPAPVFAGFAKYNKD